MRPVVGAMSLTDRRAAWSLMAPSEKVDLRTPGLGSSVGSDGLDARRGALRVGCAWVLGEWAGGENDMGARRKKSRV